MAKLPYFLDIFCPTTGQKTSIEKNIKIKKGRYIFLAFKKKLHAYLVKDKGAAPAYMRTF